MIYNVEFLSHLNSPLSEMSLLVRVSWLFPGLAGQVRLSLSLKCFPDKGLKCPGMPGMTDLGRGRGITTYHQLSCHQTKKNGARRP